MASGWWTQQVDPSMKEEFLIRRTLLILAAVQQSISPPDGASVSISSRGWNSPERTQYRHSISEEMCVWSYGGPKREPGWGTSAETTGFQRFTMVVGAASRETKLLTVSSNKGSHGLWTERETNNVFSHCTKELSRNEQRDGQHNQISLKHQSQWTFQH